jgi:hypothetical protein
MSIFFDTLPYKQGVTGSNPVIPTKSSTFVEDFFIYFFLAYSVIFFSSQYVLYTCKVFLKLRILVFQFFHCQNVFSYPSLSAFHFETYSRKLPQIYFSNFYLRAISNGLIASLKINIPFKIK